MAWIEGYLRWERNPDRSHWCTLIQLVVLFHKKRKIQGDKICAYCAYKNHLGPQSVFRSILWSPKPEKSCIVPQQELEIVLRTNFPPFSFRLCFQGTWMMFLKQGTNLRKTKVLKSGFYKQTPLQWRRRIWDLCHYRAGWGLACISARKVLLKSPP